MSPKKAVITQAPRVSKQAKTTERPGQILDSQISWHFHQMDSDRKGPWPTEPKKLNKHLDQIHSFESMTIAEIFHSNHDNNHPIPIDELAINARKRLNELKVKAEELHSLRLAGKPRLWGVLIGNIFKILWYDPEHKVCPSKKKHT